MNNKTIISVVIPCFNHGKYIEETIKSVENSIDKYSTEIIIINDGSTDPFTLQIFKNLEANGYFVLHQKNQGLPQTRNNGISIAKGRYIIPLDSDNKVKPPYLNSVIDLLEKDSTIDIVYGNVEYIGDKTGISRNKPIDKKRMLFSNHIDACAVYRKTVWESVGGYATDLPERTLEDWNFWLRCINLNKKFHHFDETCFEYRVIPGSMIRSTTNEMVNRIFSYNVASFPNLYRHSINEDYNKIESVFYGGILRRITKITLNFFGIYKY